MAMETLGLAIPTPGGGREFLFPRSSGHGRSVAILGAGISGLRFRYELHQAGYRVRVLGGARPYRRPLLDHSRRRPHRSDRPSRSVATFDPGLYFNSGPGAPEHPPADPERCAPFRGPARTIHQRQPQRRLGFCCKVHPNGAWSRTCAAIFAELLAKAIDQHALDRWCQRTSSTQFASSWHPNVKVDVTL